MWASLYRPNKLGFGPRRSPGTNIAGYGRWRSRASMTQPAQDRGRCWCLGGLRVLPSSRTHIVELRSLSPVSRVSLFRGRDRGRSSSREGTHRAGRRGGAVAGGPFVSVCWRQARPRLHEFVIRRSISVSLTAFCVSLCARVCVVFQLQVCITY